METHRLFCYAYKPKYCFWFRIRGYGLSFRNSNKYPSFFSERSGYTKILLIGNIRIKLLRPYPVDKL